MAVALLTNYVDHHISCLVVVEDVESLDSSFGHESGDFHQDTYAAMMPEVLRVLAGVIG